MDVGAREMTEVKTLLSGNRDIMNSLNYEKVSNDHIGAIPCLAAFAILATFKDGHRFKEGQLENGLTNTRLSTTSLDYTCGTFCMAIWGKSSTPLGTVAIMWLKGFAIDFQINHILLTTIILQNFALTAWLYGRNPCPISSLVGC